MSLKILKKQLILCGSMSYYNEFVQIKRHLSDLGIKCIIPASDAQYELQLKKEAFDDYKRSMSYKYITKIKQLETIGVLIYNPEKHGIKNYIGPNTFAEIAVAFSTKKRIFIYYDLPSVYYEELTSWRCSCYKGNYLKLYENIHEYFQIENAQLELFNE